MCTRLPPDTGQMRADGRKSKPRSRRNTKPDGRTAGARRLKALIAAFSANLGALSTADEALVRQAAVLTLLMEITEADIAAGKPVDSDALIRLAGASRRALAAVSAKAVDRKPAGQTLAEYMAAKARTAEHSEDDGED
jgi:hypothetical protein